MVGGAGEHVVPGAAELHRDPAESGLWADHQVREIFRDDADGDGGGGAVPRPVRPVPRPVPLAVRHVPLAVPLAARPVPLAALAARPVPLDVPLAALAARPVRRGAVVPVSLPW